MLSTTSPKKQISSRKPLTLIFLLLICSAAFLSAQEELGRWPGIRRGAVEQCVVDGSVAYLAGSTGALVTLDVSDPSSPKRLASITVQDGLYGVAVDKGIAYCAGKRGLSIVNVSDPATPALLKTLDLGAGRRVAVNGNILCFAGTQLKIVDITNPSDPVIRSSFATPDKVADVDLSGNYAFVALGYQNSPEVIIQVIDLSDLDAPTMVWENRRKIFVGPYTGPQIHIDGSRAYVASVDESWILDISNPVRPSILGKIPSNPSVFDVCGSGNFAYVANHSGGLTVYDVSNPSSPTYLSRVRPTTYTGSGIIQGNHYYAADLYDGLHVIDVANPSRAVEVGHYSDVGQMMDVAVAGSHAFIADGWSGLRVLDISDPTDIIECSSHLLPDANSIKLVGDIAFVGGGRHAGLWIFDVSDPCNPKLLSNHATYRFDVGNAISISEGYAYIAKGYCSGWSGVRILDVQDPENPHSIEDYPVEGHAYDISVDGGLMVVANDGELDVVNIKDPSNPVRIGRTNGAGNISRFCRNGRFVYCSSAYTGSIQVVDLLVPSDPTIVFTVPISGYTIDLFVLQGHLYRCRDAAVEVYDVRPLGHIEFVSKFATHYPSSIFSNHDLLAVADYYDGAIFYKRPYGRVGLTMRVAPSAGETSLNLRSTAIGTRYQLASSNDLRNWTDCGIIEGNGHTVYKDVTGLCDGKTQMFFRFTDLGKVGGKTP